MTTISKDVDSLRKQLAQFTEEAKSNQRILEQAQARELELLNAENIPDLFDVMIRDLRRRFRLQQVTLVLCDPDHEVRHLLMSAGGKPEQIANVIFVDTLPGFAPQYATLRTPWLGRYSRSDHALVFPDANDIKSVALIPLVRQERLMGSLNFASSDASRYTRQHATDILAHLGVIASFALENTVNRARLLRSGTTDVLTGWHNRRYLLTRLHEEISSARRNGSTLVCLLLDIDHFKKVNDQHGHQSGDYVLTEFAHRIEAVVRASDVAARYGGEEFVVLLPDTDANAAAILAERIREAVGSAPFQLGDGTQETVTVSIGIAELRPGRDDSDTKTLAEGLLARADVALYQSKSAGRNRVSMG